MIETTEQLRWLWLLLGVLTAGGILAAFLGLADALADQRYIKIAHENGAKQIIVSVHIRTEAIRLFLQAMWLIVAVVNFTDDRVAVVSAWRIFNVAILVVGAALMLFLSATCRRDRTRIMDCLTPDRRWDGRERRRG